MPSSTRSPSASTGTGSSAAPVSSSGWKLEALEKKIFASEERLEQLGAQLALPETYNDAEKATDLRRQYEALEQEITDLTQIWDEMT